MSTSPFIEHGLITGVVLVFHLLLLWIDMPAASRHPHSSKIQRRLWRRFVGLLFQVLVGFANASLVLSKGPQRIAALVAICVIAAIVLDWKLITRKLEADEKDPDE